MKKIYVILLCLMPSLVQGMDVSSRFQITPLSWPSWTTGYEPSFGTQRSSWGSNSGCNSHWPQPIREPIRHEHNHSFAQMNELQNEILQLRTILLEAKPLWECIATGKIDQQIVVRRILSSIADADQAIQAKVAARIQEVIADELIMTPLERKREELDKRIARIEERIEEIVCTNNNQNVQIKSDLQGVKNDLERKNNTLEDKIKTLQQAADDRNKHQVITFLKQGSAYVISSEVGAIQKAVHMITKALPEDLTKHAAARYLQDVSAHLDLVAMSAIISAIEGNAKEFTPNYKQACLTARNSAGIIVAALAARKVLPKKYTTNWSAPQKAFAFAAAHLVCDIMTTA